MYRIVSSCMFLTNYYLILHGQHTSAGISQSLYSTAELSDLWQESRSGQHEAIPIFYNNQVVISVFTQYRAIWLDLVRHFQATSWWDCVQHFTLENSFVPTSIKILNKAAGGYRNCAVNSWCSYHWLCKCVISGCDLLQCVRLCLYVIYFLLSLLLLWNQL